MMPRRTLLILLLLILVALLSALAGALAGLIKLPAPISSQPLVALLIVGMALGVLGWWLWRMQSPPEPQQMPTFLTRQNRQRMVAAVRAIWITGVLEHSLHHTALLALGLQEQPAAVENPWRLAVQDVERPPHDLPVGTRITKVFDDAGGKLLILGAPGAGKTTLLLELTRDLLARAEQDEQLPIPVIFSLSSWASKQVKLDEWFVQEMKLKYQIPEKIGRAWVEHDQLVLLLDGLDEVAETQRTACVEAINAYQQQGHGLVPLVLCSRETDYQALPQHILLRRGVIIKPLTPTQIDAYLSSAGSQLNAVRIALQDDADLRALATSPLMLSVLSLAYQGQSPADLLTTPSDQRQHHLFAIYVQRMLARRKAATRYTMENTQRWLAWLAQQMVQRNQAEFYPNYIQPDWLGNPRSRQLYFNLVLRINGVLAGVACLLMAWPFFGLISGLISGLLIGWFFGSRSNNSLRVPGWTRRRMRRDLIEGSIGGLLFGLSLAFYVWFGVFILSLFVSFISEKWISTDATWFFGAWGLVLGIPVGFLKMVEVSMKRIVLHIFFWRSGCIPFRYVAFLDYAADRILLRKVGSGYSFIHRLLLDYFADLDTTTAT